jgi:hypothetical protein
MEVVETGPQTVAVVRLFPDTGGFARQRPAQGDQ